MSSSLLFFTWVNVFNGAIFGVETSVMASNLFQCFIGIYTFFNSFHKFAHGIGETFKNYADYYNGHQDDNAICYLTLANKLIHEFNPHALTVAEEVSGMPGIAVNVSAGGYGFDYRMAMNIPDYWIKTIKEKVDEDWKPTSMFWEVTNRRTDEKTISYCESHAVDIDRAREILLSRELFAADLQQRVPGLEPELVRR